MTRFAGGFLATIGIVWAVAPVRADDPKPGDPAEAKKSAAAEEYRSLRPKAGKTANAQWKLAVWCEEHGLKDEAREHFTAVIRLDPKREAAWKRLGYKRFEGKWLTAEQVAAENEMRAAIRRWGGALAAIHKEIHRGPRAAEARKALDEIVDDRAVPAVYREFGKGSIDQLIAVQVLGQIQGTTSSKTLAYFSIYGASADVRARATETLRGRNPSEYAEALIELILDPLKYEVRAVGGPDSPGVLFVEGDRYNLRRFYTAPAPDVFRPGDMIGIGADGEPALIGPLRELGFYGAVIKGTKSRVTNYGSEVIPVREIERETLKSGLAAEAQQEADVAEVQALNRARDRFTRVVIDVLKDATGKDGGKGRQSWRDWLAKVQGSRPGNAPAAKPTLDMVMPASYTPTVAFTRMVFLQTSVPDS